MKEKRLEDYVCIMPFRYLSPFEDHIDACCGDWCDIKVPYNDTIEHLWQSERMQEFRKSIIDGTYEHCNDKCPFKIGLKNYSNTGGGIFLSKSDIDINSTEWDIKNPPLEHIKFCSDTTCNLYCKSCRVERIITKGEDLKRQIKDIESTGICKTVKRIDLLGSGDPFVSREARNWLINFKPEKYPNLENIHIHSNAQLWTPQMCQRITKALPYIKSFEISIDAATEETYEKIRRGGHWKTLIDNINWLLEPGNLPNLCDCTFSFVIQRWNYTEIVDFYKLICSFKDKNDFTKSMWNWPVRFSPAEKWGPSDEEYSTEINIRNSEEILQSVKADIKSIRNLRKDILVECSL